MTLVELTPEEINLDGHVRRDLGDVSKLAESMRAVGLLYPVLVDEWHNLIDGARRVAAARQLGWPSITGRIIGDLDERGRILDGGNDRGSAVALRITRDANVCRKSLTTDEVAEIGRRFMAAEREEDFTKPAPGECCVVCGQEAMRFYPPDAHPDEASASCGSMRCELRIQRGMDEMEEAGNR